MDAFPLQSSQRCESVKALHTQRSAIRKRLLEKQKQRQQEARHAQLNTARRSGGDGNSEFYLGSSDQNENKVDHSALRPDDSLVEEDWHTFGEEFGLDMRDPVVLNYCLVLEEEIRQEQLFEMYESSHPQNQNEWEDYYRSLTS
ncbi:unnamed protein product [Phytomonas sp. Hart1]|nr:unnamed protein product [Phytomonas sp. Hart1]|eukprot:CCW68980.1 unnamed protein product [Phytomonas sp. isolate Hart1]